MLQRSGLSSVGLGLAEAEAGREGYAISTSLAYLGFSKRPAGRAVGAFVFETWSSNPSAPLASPMVELLHPDGGAALMVALDGTLAVEAQRGAVLAIPRPLRSLRAEMAGQPRMMGVRLRPGAFRLLFDEDAEEAVPLEGSELDPWLDGTLGFEAWAAQRLARRPPPPDFLARRAALGRALATERNVADLAARLGTSRRQLERWCQTHIGSTPRQLIGLRRAWRARRLIGMGVSGPELALRAGYYDQAHLIRGFRAVSGMTPEGYRRRRALAAEQRDVALVQSRAERPS